MLVSGDYMLGKPKKSKKTHSECRKRGRRIPFFGTSVLRLGDPSRLLGGQAAREARASGYGLSACRRRKYTKTGFDKLNLT